jgi:NADH-quinone oxidoreductase subunit B
VVKVVQVGLACCAVESATADLVDSAIELVAADPEHLAHVLVIAGTVTTTLASTVQSAYDALPTPRVVVAFGACAISGGPYWDSYSVVPGASAIIPVDIRVPGCPPSPQDLAAAMTVAIKAVTS